MSRIIIVGVFFLLAGPSIAQRIRILDEANNEPIADAMIYSDDKHTFTTSNENGQADLSIFMDGIKVSIQHPSYYTHQLQIKRNDKLPTVVYLKEKIVRIEEIVISANKWEQNKSEIPFDILSLEAAEMQFSNPQTSADLLEASGKIFVQKSQLGGGSPMIRGFGANSVLLVVDGVRMNNTIFRSGNVQNVINIDPNALESSEVIFGPGAVIYGSDALGGVMDFHTISPSFSNDDQLRFDGRAMMRYSSANHEKTIHTTIGISGKKTGYVGSITVSDFDDLRTGAVRPKAHPDFGKRPEYVETTEESDVVVPNSNENAQKFSGYQQLSTLQKVVFRAGENLDLGYNFNYSTTSDIPRYDRLIEYSGEDPKYADWYYGQQSWLMNSLNLKYYKARPLFDAMKITTAYQVFEESRHDRGFQQANLRNRTEKVQVLSINGDFEKVISEGSQIFYGTEYTFNHVNSSAYQVDITTNEISNLSTRYPGGGSNVHTLALYSSIKRNIKDQLFISGGLRFTYQDLLSRFLPNEFSFSSIENKSSALNGNIGLVYKPNKNWNISGMLSSGFRAPNVDDISKVFDSEPGYVVVPNPDLKPEYSYNSELTALRYLGEGVQLSATVFYSLLRDAMVRADFQVNGRDSIIYDGALSRVQAIVNAQKAIIYGFDISLLMDLTKQWSASLNLNYTEGKELDTNESLRHTTPLFGNASIVYHRNRFQAEFYSRFNGKRALKDLPPSERNKPHLYSSDGSLAWFTLNARAKYQFSEMVSFNCALENILDHHYRTYSSGISAPGRNIIISLKVDF